MRQIIAGFCLSCWAVAWAGERAVFLEVHNTGPRLFQHVVELSSGVQEFLRSPRPLRAVETDATGKMLREAVAETHHRDLLPDLTPAPSVVSLLLDGITESGARRYFLIRDCWADSHPETDLRADRTLGGWLISNQYFSAHVAEQGHGGFPETVTFNGSGNRCDGFFYGDRVYSKERGSLHLDEDTQSKARICHQGPLRIVVETSARYGSPGRYASDQTWAAYRFVYRAYSPIVDVSCHVSRKDDYPWQEIHFLQLSRKDTLFPRWAGGEPVQKGAFLNAKSSQLLRPWGVMFNGDDAVGLAHPDGVVLYDGTDYFNYLQTPVIAWDKRTYKNAAQLYFGPALPDPQRYAQLLAADGLIKVRQLPLPKPPEPIAAKYLLQNDDLALEFASEEAGLGLVRLSHAAFGYPRFVTSPDERPLLWRIELRGEDKALKPITLDNRVEAKRSASLRLGKLELRWEGVEVDGERGALDVVATIELQPETGLSHWRLRVANRSKRYGVWDVFFPVLSNLGADEPLDVAVPRSNWGMLYRACKQRQTGSYPSCDWPMQFLCLDQEGLGLYLACHDPQAWPKRFSLTPSGELYFQTHAANQGVAGSGYDQPFPIAIAGYSGDWWQGAKLYRQWATANAPWARKGPLLARKDTPKKLLDLGLWMLGGGHAREVVPKMHEAAKLFEVPIGIHWYNWHEIPFDTYYPNYFPTKPGFAEAVKGLVGEGMVIMPYINGRLWDSGNENFKDALPYACKTPDGKPYLEEYGSGRKLAVMCPYTKFWQDKVAEICRRLMTECGVNAIYIDQIAAAGPVLCYDKTHGHPLGGGSWWADGYRAMLTRINEMAHSEGRDVTLTTENNAEPYMDNVNAFLVWNPRFDNEIPMMTAVYGGLTTYFSSPSAVNDELKAFATSQGRDFLFGCQPGWMGFELLDPKNRAKADYLRDLAAHRLAAAKFMVHGELLCELKPTRPVPTVEVTWGRGWGAQGGHKAVLPAVMATVWRAPDGELAIIAANWDERPHVLCYQFDPSLWSPGGWREEPFQPQVYTRIALTGAAHNSYVRRPWKEQAHRLEPREILVLAVKAAPSPKELLHELAEQSRTFLVDARPPSLWGSVERRCRKLYSHLLAAKPKDERLARAARQCVAEVLTTELDLGFSTPQVIGESNTPANHPLRVRLCAVSRGRQPVEVELNAGATTRRVRMNALDSREIHIEGPAPRLPEGAEEPESERLQDLLRTPRRLRDEAPPAEEAEYLRVSFVDYSPCALEPPLCYQVVQPFTVDLQVVGAPRAGEEHLVHVTVANNTPHTESPTLMLQAPATWEITPGRQVRLPAMGPGKKRLAAFLCRVPADAVPALTRIGASVSAGGSSARVNVAEPRPEAKAPHRNGAPKIDGDLADWANTPPIVVEGGRHVRVEGWKGPADCSAKLWTGWDETRFFIAAEVQDDVFDQKQSGFAIWQGDCIQMALCPGPPPGEPGYDGVIEFGLAQTPSGPQVFQWHPHARAVEGARLVVRSTPGRLVYEAAIPWASLGAWRPTAGQSVGWSFTVNDADGSGFRGWLEWTPGICGTKDAHRFGRLVLER